LQHSQQTLGFDATSGMILGQAAVVSETIIEGCTSNNNDRGSLPVTRLRVGIIGTGKKKPRGDAMGYAMAYEHAAAYATFSSFLPNFP